MSAKTTEGSLLPAITRRKALQRMGAGLGIVGISPGPTVSSTSANDTRHLPAEAPGSNKSMLGCFRGVAASVSSERAIKALQEIHTGFVFGSYSEQAHKAGELSCPVFGLGWSCPKDKIPDWSVKKSDGSPFGDGQYACWNSPFRDYVLAQIEEYVKKYAIDGLLLDAVWWGVFGRPEDWCCCDYCKRLYGETFGKELPILARADWTKLDPPTMKQCIEWRRHSLEEFSRLARAKIKSIRPDLPISFHGQTSFFVDRGNFFSRLSSLRLSDFAYWEWYGDELFYSALLRGLSQRPVMGHAPYHMEAIEDCWPASSLHPPLAGYSDDYCNAIISGMLAHGCRPIMWLPSLPGGGLTKNSISLMESIYREVEEKEQYVQDASPILYAAIVYSDAVKTYYRRDDPEKSPLPSLRGAFHVLQKLRVPVEFLADMDLEALKKFKIVILPNTAILRQTQVEAISQYVKEGGSILCTYETSLYDELGEIKGNFDLSDVLGLKYVATRTYKPSDFSAGFLAPSGDFLRPLQDLLTPLEKKSLFMRGPCIVTEPTGGMSKAALSVDSSTSVPAVHVNHFGKGRSAYISTPIFKRYTQPATPPALPKEVIVIPFGRRGWITDLTRELLNELAPSPPIRVEGSDHLESTFFEQKKKDRVIVHLLNSTVRELGKVYPMEPANILIRRDFIKPRKAYSAWPERKDLAVKDRGECLEIMAPATKIHQIVVIER